jgi:hypothetical protein
MSIAGLDLDVAEATHYLKFVSGISACETDLVG